MKPGEQVGGYTLVEISELRDHPWMVGTQFHPEFRSRPNRPHPLFRDFIGAAAQRAGLAPATEAAVERVLAEMNSEEFETYIMRLAERGEKIALAVQAGRNDPATIREREAYQREAAVMVKEQQRRMKVAMAGISAEQQRARTENPRLVQACGQEPKAPQQPNSGVGGAEGVLLGHGARAAGLDGEEASTPESVESYKIMRERVLNWVEEKQRPSRMGFSSDEIKVLESQAGAVKQVVSDMKKAGVPL